MDEARSDARTVDAGGTATTQRQRDAAGELHSLDRLLIGEPEIAELCGVSRPIIRRWVAAGLLNRVKLPFDTRRNLYRVADVEQLVECFGIDGDAG